MAAIAAAWVPPVARAAEDKVLQRVHGSIGYQTSDTAPFAAVVGRFLLPDDYFAVTRAQSAAVLTLPDSSIVGLGENTNIRVGAFNETAAGPGSTVTVNGGTLRFDIRRPQGGAANYRFLTSTSQLAVRGTVGLLSFINGVTTVACIACAADSVSVTVGTQTYTLASGQLLTVSAAGSVVTVPLTSTALATFSAAGVTTTPSTGVAAATITSGAGAGGGTLAAAGLAAGIAAGVVSQAVQGSPAASPVNPNATLSPTPTPTPTATPTPIHTPTPAPTPTPTTSANVTVSSKARVVAPLAPPAPVLRRP